MNKIKELLKALEAAEKKLDKIDEAYEQDPENEALEAKWMEAYKAEHSALNELKAALVSFTGGKIDEETARRLILGKRQELKDLLSLAKEE